jgi:hypothetical protein
MRTRPHRTIQNEQRCDEQVAEREHAACARPRRPFTTGSPGAGVPLSAEREHADEPSRALPCGSDAFPTHNVIARARYALPNRCLADDRSLSLALWALLL